MSRRKKRGEKNWGAGGVRKAGGRITGRKREGVVQRVARQGQIKTGIVRVADVAVTSSISNGKF